MSKKPDIDVINTEQELLTFIEDSESFRNYLYRFALAQPLNPNNVLIGHLKGAERHVQLAVKLTPDIIRKVVNKLGYSTNDEICKATSLLPAIDMEDNTEDKWLDSNPFEEIITEYREQ